MAENKKYVDNNGLAHLWLLLKEKFSNKVDKVEGKGLSTNDLTNELLTKINNAGDSSFSGNYDDLTGKPDLTDMATKTYVMQQLANINKKQIVTSINEMTDPNTIYLLANSGTGNNVYDEYILVNETVEKVGTTEVDLTGYIKESDLVEITNAEIDEIFAE